MAKRAREIARESDIVKKGNQAKRKHGWWKMRVKCEGGGGLRGWKI